MKPLSVVDGVSWYKTELWGETLNLGLERRKLQCREYDLEAERVALILSGGLGEGVGVALLALEDYWKESNGSVVQVEGYFKHLNKYPLAAALAYKSDEYRRKGIKIIYCYMSYSLSLKIRGQAISSGVLPLHVWKRMLKEDDQELLVLSASKTFLPISFLPELVSHSNWFVREAISHSERLSEEMVEVLSRDVDSRVRSAIAKHPKLKGRALSEMATDSDWEVIANLGLRYDLPDELAQELSKVNRFSGFILNNMWLSWAWHATNEHILSNIPINNDYICNRLHLNKATPMSLLGSHIATGNRKVVERIKQRRDLSPPIRKQVEQKLLELKHEADIIKAERSKKELFKSENTGKKLLADLENNTNAL